MSIKGNTILVIEYIIEQISSCSRDSWDKDICWQYQD